MKCERCGVNEARPQVCPGDGRHHYHGEVHLPSGGRQAVCGRCIRDVDAEWHPERVQS